MIVTRVPRVPQAPLGMTCNITQTGSAWRRSPYIMILLLALALALGACAPRSHVGGEVPTSQGMEIEGANAHGDAHEGTESYELAYGVSDESLNVSGADKVVTQIEVLNIALPSKYANGKKMTDEERQALLTVSDLDRSLSIADYEIIMPYFSFYMHKSRVTIKHMVKNADPYIAYVRKTFRENGIPEELAYLGMIESIYRPSAVSPAGAAGVWQFMPGTGKAYGLQQDWWVDERRDVYKATHAAVKYLKVLYNYFDDWLLVITAYNAGEGTVLRALKETNTDNFFDLVRKSKGPRARLKPESQRYAPSFLAVTKIMRNLELLGFDDFATEVPAVVPVKVPAGTDLLALTDAIGISWKEFTQRNAAFRRYVSSPDGDTIIYFDAKYSQQAMAFLSKPHQTYAGWTAYKIKKGDTLGAISHRTGVPVSVLCRVNSVSPKNLKIGSTIMIPSKAGADLHAGLAQNSSQGSGQNGTKKKQEATKQDSKKQGAERQQPRFTGETTDYIVKKGDTLYDIAHAHDLGWKVVMEANGLSHNSRLRVGQHLIIPVKEGQRAGQQVLAEKYAVTLNVKGDTEASNHVVKNASVDTTHTNSQKVPKQSTASKPAHEKASPSSHVEQAGSQERVVHVVKKGDTLYSIARKYGTDVTTLMKVNNIKDVKSVGIGRRLDIPVASKAPKSVDTYVVQQGDNMWSIARQFKMSPTALLEQNDLTEKSILRPGDVLKVTRN